MQNKPDGVFQHLMSTALQWDFYVYSSTTPWKKSFQKCAALQVSLVVQCMVSCSHSNSGAGILGVLHLANVEMWCKTLCSTVFVLDLRTVGFLFQKTVSIYSARSVVKICQSESINTPKDGPHIQSHEYLINFQIRAFGLYWPPSPQEMTQEMFI